MRNTSTIIIDEDKNYIDKFKTALTQNCSKIEIRGTAQNLKEGCKLIRSENPQLLFLGTKLEGSSGFELLEKLKTSKKPLPHIIFLSADEQSALQAIKYKPLDFLLKLEPENTAKLIKQACKEFESNMSFTTSSNKINYKPDSALKYIGIPNRQVVEMINTDKIIYLEANGKNTNFHLNESKCSLTSPKNIGDYEHILDKSKFFRIHKSYIVNLEHLLSIDRSAGNYCVLINGVQLPIAKRRLKDLESQIHLK